MALFTRATLKKEATLRKSSGTTKTASAQLLDESWSFDPDMKYDVFLSHASLDADEVLDLKTSIEKLGYSVYVDWIHDAYLNRSRVTRQTAELLKQRMHACRSLFFATTTNFQGSVWMPWELGYFDGRGGQVAILPVLDEQPSIQDAYQGREYLSLYPYVSRNNTLPSDDEDSRQELFINLKPDTYVSLPAWLKGIKPWPRKLGHFLRARAP